MSRHSKRPGAVVASPGVERLAQPAAKHTILFLAAIVLLTAAVRVPLLNIPFERDEGEYAYIAWRLEHHELPYRDWVDQKPPGVFWVYRLALSLPLDPIRAVHLMGLLFSVASACALFFLALRFMRPPWAATAAVLLGVLSIDPLLQGTAANTEIFMLLPLILSLLVFLSVASDHRQRIPFIVLCGALTGIAAAFKQVAAVNWLLLVSLYPLFARSEKRARNTWTFAGWSALGAGAVWASIGVYFYARGGLGDLVHSVLGHNLEYVNTLTASTRVTLCLQTLATLSRSQSLVWVLSGVGFAALFMTRRTKSLVLLAGWLVASLAGVSASGYFFPHYFEQTVPILALTAALGAEALHGARFWRMAPAWGRAAAVGTALAILPGMVLYPFLFTYTPAEAVRRIYPGNQFAEMPALGSRIREMTRSDERVFIFGSEPELLFYAERVSATRYIFLNPLYGRYHDAREQQIATTEEISRSRPGVAVVMPDNLFFLPDTEQFFTRWSQSYVKEGFRPDVYLTVDQGGTGSVVLAVEGGLPPGLAGQIVAGVMLLKP